ncbi:hypothetical protein AGOR_G00141440 [Albula goreensis]|uniref:Protein FAM162B n=1 Tax=Albula goreensis TaxID=1534307 RepID=A0A8T3D5A7_9TELE|nr:hypothetical protein AGOR_G00141440 [Albula goreensis]
MTFFTFMRSRPAFGTLLGHWGRQGSGAAARRRLCIKPQESSPEPAANTPTPPGPETITQQPSRPGLRVPGYRPSEFDKKVLIWSGRFKTKEQIPDMLSFETIDMARNRVRVKACYVMMALTIVSCLGMVFLGKQAVRRHESLMSFNMEKKARWRAEAQKEREEQAAAAIAMEKAQ